MKRVISCLAIGGILAAITLCVVAASPGTDGESSEIEQLKKEIETLNRRVESLEKRLKDGPGSALPHGRTRPPTIIDPNGLPWPRSTPRDWRKFEFNGMPYYVVPIDGFACPGAESGR